MALKKGVKVERGYATVVEDEGVNYREIAETMTEMGFTMNHSSARNHVLRVMRKFAVAFGQRWNIDLDDAKVDEIAKSPLFQQGVSELLQTLESQRRWSIKEPR